MNKLNFAGSVERACARALVAAWLAVRASAYDGLPGFCVHYFDPKDFGHIFESLGWPAARIRVEIGLDQHEENKDENAV